MLTVRAQDSPCASAPPERERFAPAAAAVPPHVLLRPLGLATTRPSGRATVNPMPLNGAEKFGLVMVKARVVEPFSGTVAAPNAIDRTGGVMIVTVVNPEIDASATSVAVRICVTGVFRTATNAPEPFARAASAGSNAFASVLVKVTVPP